MNAHRVASFYGLVVGLGLLALGAQPRPLTESRVEQLAFCRNWSGHHRQVAREAELLGEPVPREGFSLRCTYCRMRHDLVLEVLEAVAR